MERRRFRRVGSALASGAVLVTATFVSAGSASASGGVSLTQVSSDPFGASPYNDRTSFHATEVEPDTFASGSTVVAAFQVGRFSDGGASDVGFATSTDGGSTWTHGSLFNTKLAGNASGYDRDTDPSVAYDASHNVWLIASLALNTTAGVLRGVAVIVNRAGDPTTLSSGAPVAVAAASANQDFDKDWIVCDNTPTSKFFGRCYAQWDDHGNGNRLRIAYSSDGGVTWTQSRVPNAGVIGGQPVVQPNGTVVVPLDNAFETAVGAVVSTNGGVKFSVPVTIATISSHTVAGNLRGGPLPSAEVDGAGKVYVAWQDCRFETRCSANDIVMSSSTDGKSWSGVTRIPIDAVGSGVDHFLPGLAVDPTSSGGSAHLALTYYFYPSATCTTSTCQLEVGFVSSGNGGSTWTGPTQLTTDAISLATLPLTNQGYMVGDYLSTSYVTQPITAARPATSVFAVGYPVAGTTCMLGAPTSCNVPMDAPSTPLTASGAAAGTSGSTATTSSAPSVNGSFAPDFEPSDLAPGIARR